MKITTLLLSGLVLSYAFSQTSVAGEYEHLGYLDNSAMSSQHPKEMYHLTKPKKLKAYLVGDADVDLYLYSYDGGVWTKVAQSNSRSWVEILNYNAVCGGEDVCDEWYSWFVVLKSPNESGGNFYIKLVD